MSSLQLLICCAYTCFAVVTFSIAIKTYTSRHLYTRNKMMAQSFGNS